MKLDKYGDEWKDCYIKFKEPSIKQVQNMSNVTEKEQDFDVIDKILEESFIAGKAFNGEAIVDLEKGDLSELPFTIYRDCMNFLLSGFKESAKK